MKKGIVMANFPQKNGNLLIVDKVGDSVELTSGTVDVCFVAKKGSEASASVLIESSKEDMVAVRDWINGWLEGK